MASSLQKLRVTVDGRAYDVTVELPEGAVAPVAKPAGTPVAAAPAPAPVAVAAPAPVPSVSPAPAGATAGAVTSPLAGKVVSLDVAVGAVVAAGAQVATVEAMKMNTHVYAASAGKVTGLCVQPGQAVEEGTVLLTLG